MHNVPKYHATKTNPNYFPNFAGAVRVGDYKLLFAGMQTEGSHACTDDPSNVPVECITMTQMPPPGLPPRANDTLPKPYAYTPPGESTPVSAHARFGPNATAERVLRQVDTWLFHIPSDPTESHNLAASDAAQLAKMVRWYQEYQKTAVDDLAITKCPNGFMAKCADPKGNPGLRPDKAWGPFLGSTECKWE